MKSKISPKKSSWENLLEKKERVRALKIEMKNARKSGRITEWHKLSRDLQSVRIKKTDKINKPKSPTRTKIVKILDIIHQFYSRLKHTNKAGYVHCCTCGKFDFFGNLSGGHCRVRWNYATRWLDINCNAQCNACNWHINKGEQGKHVLYIDKIYWAGSAQFIFDYEQDKIPTYEITRMIEEKVEIVKGISLEKNKDVRQYITDRLAKNKYIA